MELLDESVSGVVVMVGDEAVVSEVTIELVTVLAAVAAGPVWGLTGVPVIEWVTPFLSTETVTGTTTMGTPVGEGASFPNTESKKLSNGLSSLPGSGARGSRVSGASAATSFKPPSERRATKADTVVGNILNRLTRLNI